MPFSDPRQNFEDILRHIEYIQVSIAGDTMESLANNPVKRAAVERWLQILTEAAFRLGKHPEHMCPGPDWAGIRGLGNQLRHAYDSIDIHRIWTIVTQQLEPLKQSVSTALDALGPEAKD